MELIWWVVAIAGFLGLAICIAAGLLRPVKTQQRRMRLLANVERLTQLPEYRRAARLRTLSAVAAIVALTVAFGAAVVAAARPVGLPSTARQSDGLAPEDIMLCMGGAPTDQAVRSTLRYFAERVTGFTTQRIGLTTVDRRIVPLTRDYQYAAAQFNEFAAERAGDDTRWAPAVSYVNYAAGVEDVLALCLTGFPAFDQGAAQRRSIIYVGPGSRREPGETRPVLFTADAVRGLAEAGDVQINVLSSGPDGAALDGLVRETGGRSFSANSTTAADLSEIRENPPPQTTAVDRAVTSTETPDVPLALALLALAALVIWPVVVRR
ncbi:hypothetical protein MycrhN_1719 [Mycolicibacterium rhodesiae NBB3]|uniref:VWFA domain-containing protein n=1 Tax=Mycolicibacterium rhodesiae (strain NBB3) TaxID=710685 RepID=G8RKA7_MYCRN|nr:hypothetical protein [Mycolicibacterium rhodesiae]AEV72332.1 hypothetical protein MycrhN_1719 [Mycolicibacterium rhodesiae NBB3]